jgi:uncharacterized damage-inducible protein DinB
MQEIVRYYARCNRQINETMLDLIAAKVENPFDLPLEGYFFKTLGALLEHVWVSDLRWMQTLLEQSDHGLDLKAVAAAVPEYGSSVFTGWDEYRAARRKLDGFMEQWAEGWLPDDALKSVSRQTKTAGLIQKPLWKAVIHVFNHQTHHRGQVSNILDKLRVENNFSNLIFLD